ncbi:MAG: hypothetical protein ACXVO1_07520, partial [Tumebacillaceae bacterium]
MAVNFPEEMLRITTYIQLQDAQPLFLADGNAASSSGWLDKLKNDVFVKQILLVALRPPLIRCDLPFRISECRRNLFLNSSAHSIAAYILATDVFTAVFCCAIRASQLRSSIPSRACCREIYCTRCNSSMPPIPA